MHAHEANAWIASLEGVEMSGSGKDATHAVQTVVWGYHVYKEVWGATVSQVLRCQQECGKVHDLYSVAIVDRKRHGWLCAGPRAISALCSLFLRRNGVITCEVTLLTCGIPPGQKFVDKTFVQGGNTVKFMKVFTRESFQLYGILYVKIDCSHTLSAGRHFEPAQPLLKKYCCTSWLQYSTPHAT